MLAATDWTGIAAVITGVGTAVAAVIAAILSNRTVQQTKTPNGDPRTIGHVVADVAKKVGATAEETPQPPPAEG